MRGSECERTVLYVRMNCACAHVCMRACVWVSVTQIDQNKNENVYVVEQKKTVCFVYSFEFSAMRFVCSFVCSFFFFSLHRLSNTRVVCGLTYKVIRLAFSGVCYFVSVFLFRFSDMCVYVCVRVLCFWRVRRRWRQRNPSFSVFLTFRYWKSHNSKSVRSQILR